MEEVDKITLENLRLIGCEFGGEEVTSIDEFSAGMMVEAVGRCLIAISQESDGANYPTILPHAMSHKFKVGQQLATAVKELGYRNEIGYQTFLYPNSRDSRNVLMFLVETLPKDNLQTTSEEVLTSATLLNRVIADAVKQSLNMPWLPACCLNNGFRKVSDRYLFHNSSCVTSFTSQNILVPSEDDGLLNSVPPVYEQVDKPEVLAASLLERCVQILEEEKFSNEETRENQISSGTLHLPCSVAKGLKSSIESSETYATLGRKSRPSIAPKPGRKGTTSEGVGNNQVESSESKEEKRKRLEKELDDLRDRLNEETTLYNDLMMKIDSMNSEISRCITDVEHLKPQLEPKKKELDMKQKTVSLLPDAEDNITRLIELIDKKETQILSLVTKWEDIRSNLIDEIRELKLAAKSSQTTTQRLKAELLETKTAIIDCRDALKEKEEKKKEVEKRLANLNKSSQSRNEYTKRILDITENNRKQKVEIARVIDEILALQREINLLRGKLDRTYTVTDELVFRDAKTNESVRKMYKMLASLHSDCQQLMNVIEDKGRLTREIRELDDQIELEKRKKIDENLTKIEGDYQEIKLNYKKLKEVLKNSL